MARQPEVEPWPPLNDASKLAYLEILFPVSHFQDLLAIYFHFINPSFPWFTYRPIKIAIRFLIFYKFEKSNRVLFPGNDMCRVKN
jgi:hypothetical protein